MLRKWASMTCACSVLVCGPYHIWAHVCGVASLLLFIVIILCYAK